MTATLDHTTLTPTRKRERDRAWEQTHNLDDYPPADYAEFIAPYLHTLTIVKVSRVLGCGRETARKVHAGDALPHPRH